MLSIATTNPFFDIIDERDFLTLFE